MGGGGSLPSRSIGASGRSGGGSSRAGYKREGGGHVSVKNDPDGDISMLGVPSQIKRERGRQHIDIDSDEEEDANSLVDIENMKSYVVISDDDTAAEDSDFVPESTKGIKPIPKERVIRELGVPPVRVTRQPHLGRQLGINTEASANSVTEAKRLAEGQDGEKPSASVPAPGGKAKAKAKDVQYVGETQLFRGVYVDEEDDSLMIKTDPDAPGLDTATEAAKAKAKTTTRIRRKSSTKRAKSPVAQTSEEREEYRLKQQEAKDMVEELLDGPAKQTIAATRLEGDSADGEPVTQGELAEEERYDRRKDNVYLFQLPPVMPGLINAATKVKQEKPVASMEPPAADAAAVAIGQTKTSTTENDMIKIEYDGTDGVAGVDKQSALEPGCVGKLRVHRSGKTSLSWGGTSLQLGMGMNGRFLQSVVLMELPDNEHTATNVAAGRAMSFGSVRGKFVVTPDWSEILR